MNAPCSNTRFALPSLTTSEQRQNAVPLRPLKTSDSRSEELDQVDVVVSIDRGGLPDTVSATLDVMRLAASVGVFASHVFKEAFAPALSVMNWWGDGHEFVIIFFVISGFVIAHSTVVVHPELTDYTISRLSRLWSVLLPSLLLTFVVDVVLSSVASADSGMGEKKSWMSFRLAICSVFMNEAWLLSAAPTLNTPLWSISYEFFYYALFAAAFFPRSRRAKLLWLLAIVGLAGPKVLLLLPCWLAGVGAWMFLRYLVRLPKSANWGMFFFGALGTILILATDWRVSFFLEPNRLWFSRWFASDWVLALLLSLALIGGAGIGRSWRLNKRICGEIRNFADYTFPLYVFHYPLLSLGRGLAHWGPTDHVKPLVVTALVFVACIFLGVLTKSLRSFVDRLLRRAAVPLVGPTSHPRS